MQQFSFNPAGIFSLKDTLNLQRQKKGIPWGFKFPLILICLRVNDTFLFVKGKEK